VIKYGIFMNFWERSWSANHIKYINKVSDLGFDILEFQAQPLLEMSEIQCLEIKRESESRGIELTYSMGLDPYYDISSEDKKIRERGIDYLKRILDRIGLMDGRIISGVNYAGWGAPKQIVNNKEDMRQRSMNSVRELLLTAEKYNITYCIEAVNRFESVLINTAQEAVSYVKEINHPNLGVQLDTYHMNIEEVSIGEAILLAGPFLKHFHTGENNRTAPGRGHIDWSEVATALKQIKYKGRIVSEPFVLSGGEVGRDIKVWRKLIDDDSENQLDNEAKRLLNFTKELLA
jgi:D-psicose/D-tagatose/L-ribulose 3-epimerase